MPDVLFCTEMLNLAEFRGLAPPALRSLPAVIYFHENQLTYPDARRDERDVHFALTNILSALAAEAVWFNSAWHAESFLAALEELLAMMPDRRLGDARRRIEAKTAVLPPGLEPIPAREPHRRAGPLRILWAARWEQDKDPESFFEAIEALQRSGGDFRLSVLGESFSSVPAVFERARRAFADRIDHWGYQRERSDYLRALREADVVVSTARHEFFGIAVAEAVLSGCLAVLPRRLAYPQLYGERGGVEAAVLYGETAGELAETLGSLCRDQQSAPHTPLRPELRERGRRRVEPLQWPEHAARLDEAISEVAAGT